MPYAWEDKMLNDAGRIAAWKKITDPSEMLACLLANRKFLGPSASFYYRNLNDTLLEQAAVVLAQQPAAEARAYNDALADAAKLCALGAVRLISNGRSRVNQVDLHTAGILREYEKKIIALGRDAP